MDVNNFAEVGIGGLLAITIIKTVLPYIRPAKGPDYRAGKELADELRPIMDRQVNILDKINERDIITHGKVCSNHENIKDVEILVRDNNACLTALHKRLDRHESNR